MRRFSNALIALIGNPDLSAAQSLAKNNSHLDDPTTQANLIEVFGFLKNLAPDAHSLETQFVQESKFGRSFIRHQYALENAQQTLRCMLTYRRKTDGWRLNQLWCS